MSPILVRPVREQLEHDRVIRLLQAKNRRKFETVINPGTEQNLAVGTGSPALYPDLILFSQERGRRIQAIVEVETGESVNHLEALAQWAHFAKVRTAFHLYVPSAMVEVARRLCDDNHIIVNEIWSFHGVGDDVRFTLVHRTKETPVPMKSAPAPAQPRRKPVAPPVKRAARPQKGAAKRKPAKKSARPVKRK